MFFKNKPWVFEQGLRWEGETREDEDEDEDDEEDEQEEASEMKSRERIAGKDLNL